MRITLDATPLVGVRTGIGRYVEHLVAALPDAFERRGVAAEVRVSTWTARGGAVPDLPPSVTQVGRRVPARLVRSLWRRGSWPPVELLVGTTDVFHGTNFVSPPTRHAREVVTVHDLTYEVHAQTVSDASLLYRELVPRALARGAHVLTPTEVVAAAVREQYGLPASQVSVTHLGVDAPWFDAAPATSAWLRSRGLPDEYLVFVGSRDPRKNLHRLLEAHVALRAQDRSTPDLVLAGPAGREVDLSEGAGVHVTGWLTDAELRDLVAGARALVLPSIDEGFGLPALEALAAGRPVLAADIPVLREVAGECAVFAPPTDVDALAAGLARVLAEQDTADARAARRRRAREFTWDRTADRTVEAYLGAS
ncbi:glycosyltransferase family 4 protein [Cellulomonas humilata]|uniref:Glycosyltransferase involved in cell wall biosynthesis n=1 Tax=Cellulomonas humilata TaxID=144055 RepID=A0ABU0ED90_9CELL|nr:glycosyltransferase family 1 protein [Cellulomonas humilata]MDQ0373234.1 glycosyltransferase involved in cell wall biosynthesis [Cellulomonas humilata]